MRKNKFQIYKANGQIEAYSKSKLFHSLKRSGLSHRTASAITDKVSREVSDGTKTHDIYRKALRLVKGQSPVAAAHYSLKRSIFDLGPTGHYFEEFVSRYFEELGFKTKTCITVQGKWVKHEVDVLAEKDDKRFFVECKFHNRQGLKNDIKIALYVKARWEDIKEGPEGKNLTGFYLATNTAFTLDAITYANGTGLSLLGVNAPKNESFLEQIKKLRLYPITNLRRLNRRAKEALLSQHIILAKDIPKNLNALFSLGLKENEIDFVLKEIEMLQGGKR